MNFWIQTRLTKVQRLFVKSNTNEKVGCFSFLKLKQLLSLIMVSVSKFLRMRVKLPALHCRKSAPYCHITSATASSSLEFSSFLLLLPLLSFSLHLPSQGPLLSQEGSISGLQELCFFQVRLIKIHALSTSLAPKKQLSLVVQSTWKRLRQTGFPSHLSLRSLCN